jgi:type I restriction enzyme S subunit
VLQPYLDEINRRTSSITVKHLSSKTVAELPLPLPPRSEQDRLVDELERRLSHVDAAISGLRRSSALLDRLATVVREAVANGSLLAMDISSWTKASAGDVTEVRGGIQKQPKRRPGVNAYPFLRVANVGRGVLDLKDVHRIELFDGELKSYALQQGDLLVVEGNGSPDQIGRAAMFDGSIADCVHQNHLIRVRPSDLLDARFLNFVWNAPSTVKQLVSVASSTSGLHTLSTGKVKSVKLSIPPIRDQRLLVAEAERRLSLVFAARRTVASDRTKAVALRRSLLAAAFSGQLVPQDEGDEPATVLLERIKASSPADDGPVGRRSKRKEKVS